MKHNILFPDFPTMGLDSSFVVSLNDLSTFVSERYDFRIPFKFEIRWRIGFLVALMPVDIRYTISFRYFFLSVD